MRTIVLMRHGQAVGSAPSGRDADRVLTSEGQRQATAAGRGLHSLGLSFDSTWHSPYKRATETFALVQQQTKTGNATVDDGITPQGNPEEVAERLFAAKARSLLVVSHLPLLPGVAAHLLGGAWIDLSTAGCIKLTVFGADNAKGSCVLAAVLPVEVFAHLSPRT